MLVMQPASDGLIGRVGHARITHAELHRINRYALQLGGKCTWQRAATLRFCVCVHDTLQRCQIERHGCRVHEWADVRHVARAACVRRCNADSCGNMTTIFVACMFRETPHMHSLLAFRLESAPFFWHNFAGHINMAECWRSSVHVPSRCGSVHSRQKFVVRIAGAGAGPRSGLESAPPNRALLSTIFHHLG